MEDWNSFIYFDFTDENWIMFLSFINFNSLKFFASYRQELYWQSYSGLTMRGL
jgi:hypothetical protein